MKNFVIIALFVLIVGVLCTMYFVVVIMKYKNKHLTNSKCGRALPNQTKSDLIDSHQTPLLLKNIHNPKDSKKIFDRELNAEPKLNNNETSVSSVSSAMLLSSNGNSESKTSQAEKSRAKRKVGTLEKNQARCNAHETLNESWGDYIDKELSRKLETMLMNADQETPKLNRKEHHKRKQKIAVYMILIAIAYILGLKFDRILFTGGAWFIVIGVIIAIFVKIGRGIKIAGIGILLIVLSIFISALMSISEILGG